jgi:hypothetical protein
VAEWRNAELFRRSRIDDGIGRGRGDGGRWGRDRLGRLVEEREAAGLLADLLELQDHLRGGEDDLRVVAAEQFAEGDDGLERGVIEDGSAADLRRRADEVVDGRDHERLLTGTGGNAAIYTLSVQK